MSPIHSRSRPYGLLLCILDVRKKGRHRKVKENETWGWIYDTIKLFMKVSVCRRSGADAASIDRNRDRIRMASLILFLFLVQVM